MMTEDAADEDMAPQVPLRPKRAVAPQLTQSPQKDTTASDIAEVLDRCGKSLRNIKRDVAGFTLLSNIVAAMDAPEGSKVRQPGLPVLEFSAPYLAGTSEAEVQKCCLDLRDMTPANLRQLVALMGNVLLENIKRGVKGMNSDTAALGTLLG